MSMLSRYISRIIISSILLVLLILLGVESFLELATELKDVGKGSFTFFQALMNVPFVLPTDLYELFPMAALIGSMIGLGKLANQSELVVIMAAGVSKWTITRYLLQSAFILLIAVSIIGEFVAPKATYYARDFKAMAISGGQALKTGSGVWFRDGDNFIFIKDIHSGNRLANIIRYKFDKDARLIVTSHAEDGSYQKGRWIFSKVKESNIFHDHITSRFLPTQQWDIKLDKRLLGVSNQNPNQMTLLKLYSYLRYRHQNDLGTGVYEFAFWKRIMQPFSSLVMVFLAIPFIFGPLRSVTMGLRVLTGVMIGIGFYIFNQFLAPLSQVYQIPGMFAAMFPTIIFAIMGAFLLFLKV